MAGERVPKQPAPTSAPTTSLNVSQFFGASRVRNRASCQAELANVFACCAEQQCCRVGTCQLPGRRSPDSALRDLRRRRRLGLVLRLQAKAGWPRAVLPAGGPRRVHLGRARRSSPAEPRLGGRGGSLRRASRVRRGSDVVEQNQWNAMLELCFHDVVAPKFILAAGSTLRGKGLVCVRRAERATRPASRSCVRLIWARHRQERPRLLTAGGARQKSGCLDNAHASTVVCQMPQHLTL